jgi:hypothetical protein
MAAKKMGSPRAAHFGLLTGKPIATITYLDSPAFDFLRSAQRFRIASAMRLRPSAVIFRAARAGRAVVLAGAFLAAFLEPRGRPRLDCVPASSARACCKRVIS